MGQYYMPVNIDKGEYLCPFAFGSGLKLMESCYVGNAYVDALTRLLSGDWHGDRVLLCGDYAFYESADLDGIVDFDPYERAMERYRDVSGRFPFDEGDWLARRYREGHPDAYDMPPDLDLRHLRYVVNETKGLYYDREACPVACLWQDDEGRGVARLDPLTLYLALGNGHGGGDYRGPSEELVGSWRLDAIFATDEEPCRSRFSPIRPPFCEEGVLVTATDEEIERAIGHLPDWSKVEAGELARALGEGERP